MIDRDSLLAEVVQLVEQLCDPHRHTEVIWDVDKHRNKRMSRAYSTTQDGLLRQLREQAVDGLKVGQGGPSSGKPASKPPGAWEALARHVYVCVEVASWARSQGLGQRATVEETMRGLVGQAARMDDVVLMTFVKDLRYWHGSASAATGWTSLPYAPYAPCPTCGVYGSLRINRSTNAAYCANPARWATGEMVCGATWAPGCIGPLAAHVRRTTEAA